MDEGQVNSNLPKTASDLLGEAARHGDLAAQQGYAQALPQQPTIEAQLASLEQNVKRLMESQDEGAQLVNALQNRVAALEAEQNALNFPKPSAVNPTGSTLEERVAVLQRKPDPVIPNLVPLEGRVTLLENKPHEGPTSEEWNGFKKKLDAAGIR